MNSNFVTRPRTRRELLQLGSGIVGTSLLSGLLPFGLSGSVTSQPSQSGQQAQSGGAQIQGAPASQARVAQIRAHAAAIRVQTRKLRDHIYMLSGPGGNMVVLPGAAGKVLV